MKIFICLWFTSLFSCSFSRENVLLKCGSPTCDAIISEARAHVEYHGNGVHVKRGDTVNILGKNENKYFIQHKNQLGLVPTTFLKESSILIAGDQLINVSEDIASNVFNRDLKAPSETPPLGNESIPGDAPEPSLIPNSDEISSSKPYDVIDGTTLYYDNNVVEDAVTPSIDVSPPPIENSDAKDSSESPASPKVEINPETEPQKADTDSKANDTTEGKDQVDNDEDAEDDEFVDGDENDEAEEVEDVENEVESEKGLGAQVMKALDSLLGGGDESSETQTDSSGNSNEVETQEKGESDPGNVQIPSTADLVGNAAESTAYFEPSPTVYPTKTMTPVEVTAQPSLSQNVEASDAIEPSITSTEKESSEPQSEAVGDFEDGVSTNTSIAAGESEPSGAGEEESLSSQEVVEGESEVPVQDTFFPASQTEGFLEEPQNATLSEQTIPSEGPAPAEPSFLPTTATPEQAFEFATTEKPPADFENQAIEQGDSTGGADQGLAKNESLALGYEQGSVEVPTSSDDQNEPVEDLEIGVPVTEADLAGQSSEALDVKTGVGSETLPTEGEEKKGTSDEALSMGLDETFTSEVANATWEMQPSGPEFDMNATEPEEVSFPTPKEVTLSTAEDVTVSFGEVSDGSEAESVTEATTETVPSTEQTPGDDSLVIPTAETGSTSEVIDTPTTEEPQTETKPYVAPTQEQPFVGVYDSLIVNRPPFEPTVEHPSSIPSPVEMTSEMEAVPTSENDSMVDAEAFLPSTEPPNNAKTDTPENSFPPTEDILTPVEDVEDTEGLKTFGIFGRVMEVYHSLSSIKESYLFGFMSKTKEEDIQPAWRSENLDDTCKIEDLNCLSLRHEDKPVPSIMETPSEEVIFGSLMEPMLGSTCLKAQGLLFFLTTAIVIVITSFLYFYFEKRWKDASSYKMIDSLERKLFVANKEVLELKNQLSIHSESDGTDASVSVSSARVSELEAQQEALYQNLAVLENESSVKSGLIKDLERRLQEAMSMTQNTEMIFKTVDQLQQRIEIQQRSISEMHTQLKIKDKSIEGLQESLQKAADIKTQLEEMVAALKKENETMCIESSEKIIQLNSELDQVKSEKTLEATKLRAEIDSLKLSLEQARSSLDVAEASITELKAVISDDTKNSDNLGDVFNGSELKAKLAVAELNIEKLKDRLQEETGARQFLEEHLKSVKEALEKLKATNDELEREKQEAENAVKVLKEYFRKQEEELKKEIEEKSAFQLQKDEETLFIKLRTLEEEKVSLKEQIEEMKREIVEQENIFKRERVQLEKKADDNWLLSRQINRKLQDAKQESATLRSRLTSVEKLLSEKGDPNDEQSLRNGEGVPQATVSSPSMLLNFPNTSNSSFAKYNSSDLILPPPLGMPGTEFIPPPPINFPDLRLPPLGSVGRISSPPRGMSPPTSPEANFALNFSPPPPMPHQYYYYHRSESPSDYDSSYSKGEMYRDSPSNLEHSGSSKTKSDPLRKAQADQADMYPGSNPSHPSPLKPVARNPTSSGQKGWSSSGQSSKPVEKNSRKIGR